MNTIPSLPVLPAIDLPLQPARSCPVTTELLGSLIAKTQAPADMILLVTLSHYSQILQGWIDVERPGVGVGPVSLFALTIADSGERKSTVSRLLEKPIVEFQSLQNNSYEEQLAYYEAEVEVFEESVKVLRKEISSRLKEGSGTVPVKIDDA